MRTPIVFRNLETGQALTLTTIVDPGSFLTVLPQKNALQLRLRPKGTRDFQLADGRLVTRDIGFVEVSVAGRSALGAFLPGDDGTEPRLGRVDLAQLGLALDALSGDLLPVPGRLGGGFKALS